MIQNESLSANHLRQKILPWRLEIEHDSGRKTVLWCLKSCLDNCIECFISKWTTLQVRTFVATRSDHQLRTNQPQRRTYCLYCVAVRSLRIWLKGDNHCLVLIRLPRGVIKSVHTWFIHSWEACKYRYVAEKPVNTDKPDPCQAVEKHTDAAPMRLRNHECERQRGWVTTSLNDGILQVQTDLLCQELQHQVRRITVMM